MRKTRFFSLLLMIAMLLTPVVVAFATDGEAAAIPEAWDGTVADSFASGTGTESDPFVIKNAGQLAYMHNLINADMGYFFNTEGKLANSANIKVADIILLVAQGTNENIYGLFEYDGVPYLYNFATGIAHQATSYTSANVTHYLINGKNYYSNTTPGKNKDGDMAYIYDVESLTYIETGYVMHNYNDKNYYLTDGSYNSNDASTYSGTAKREVLYTVELSTPIDGVSTLYLATASTTYHTVNTEILSIIVDDVVGYRINLDYTEYASYAYSSAEGQTIVTNNTEFVWEIYNYANAYYSLEKDIDLNYMADGESQNFSWTAMGKNVVFPFNGHFDGNNHTIKGLTQAFFSEVYGTVKNLKIADANVKGSTDTHKYGVLANKLLDGAVVSHVDVINCNLVGYYAGAIAAEAEGNITIEYCTVSGTIKQASTSGKAIVGGLIGRYLQSSGAIAVCKIDNCINDATITLTSNNGFAGGIVASYPEGITNNEMRISNCINNGEMNITGKTNNVGGILGYGYRCGLVYIQQCTNTSKISNKLGTTGGIVGYLESGTSGKPITPLIADCINEGDVIGSSSVGGIIGKAGNTSSGAFRVNRCVNFGSVTGSGDNVGGIVGWAVPDYRTMHIMGCSNHANVVGASAVGGILGYFSGNSTTLKFEVVANYGDVSATNGAAGGLIGKGETPSKGCTINVTSAMQTGTVTGAVASAFMGEMNVQQYTTTYGKKSTTANGILYQNVSCNFNVNIKACVLSSNVVGTDVATVLIGTAYGNTLPKVTLSNVLCDVQVVINGSVQDDPVHYYTATYVATAGDADLVGTENEGMTGYYTKNTSTLSYMVAYEPSAPVANSIEAGAISGGINASVNTEGSAAYILNQAAIALGDTYPWWKNGETYPVITNVIYTVTFIDRDGETISTEEVRDGQAATAPEAPIVEGYRFDGWDVAFTAVESDLTVKAIYVKTWTVTYLDIHGDVWKVEVYDEGSVPTLPAEAPTYAGYTFEGWNPPALPVVITEDIVVAPEYSVAASSANEYNIMHWTIGDNAQYASKFSDLVYEAIAEANPDILILSGMSQNSYESKFKFTSQGYTLWAYETMAVLYKTTVFTQAGDSVYTKTTDYEYAIFPLTNAKGDTLPVVSAYIPNGHYTNVNGAEFLNEIRSKLGENTEFAILRILVEESNDVGAIHSEAFITEADTDGFNFASDTGIATRKNGAHSSRAYYQYAYMVVYGKGLKASGCMTSQCPVAITEDDSKYLNSSNAAGVSGGNPRFYNKAIALSVSSDRYLGVVEQFDAASVTLQDNLLVNFKVDAEKLAGKSLLKAIVTFGGKTYEIAAGEAVDGQYIFSVPVAPHQMNDQIEIQLVFAHDLVGEWGGILTRYSVATYCYNKLSAESSSDELKALLVDILNYGAAAQVAVGYNTDNLANANLSDEQKAIGDVTADASSTQTEGMEAPEALWVSAGLLLNDKVVIRFAFEAENAEGLSVKVVLNGNEYTVSQFVPVAGAENRYYVYIEGLNATQLRDIVSVTVMRGEDAVSETLTYSVEVYATKVFAYAEVEGYENLVNLVKAMMAYGDSAEAYVASENQ